MTKKTCRTFGEEKSAENDFVPHRATCKACRQAARQSRRRAGLDPSDNASLSGKPPGRPKLPGTDYTRARDRMQALHRANRTPHPHIVKPFVTRACTRCGEEKTPIDFPLNGMHEDRLCKVCKDCHRVKRLEWAARNPERAREVSLLGQELQEEARDYYFDELTRLNAILKESGALTDGQQAYREQLLYDLGVE